MIDLVALRTKENGAGTRYDAADIWIGGVPFSADLTPRIEAVARRIAGAAGCDIVDTRDGTAEAPN